MTKKEYKEKYNDNLFLLGMIMGAVKVLINSIPKYHFQMFTLLI